MDDWEQQEQPPPPPPPPVRVSSPLPLQVSSTPLLRGSSPLPLQVSSTPPLRVSSTPPLSVSSTPPLSVSLPAATGAAIMPLSLADIMRGMPNTLNFMASTGASSAMSPVDRPMTMYRGDSISPVLPKPDAAVVGGRGEELVKKKRGRPRKYGPDGITILGHKPAAGATSEAGGHSGGAGSHSNREGKRRGRPLGSAKKKQLDALGFSGTSFTPHIIIVKPNEDVAAKIKSFSQQGPHTTCIISANGALHTATLRQPATPSGVVTYEGHYDIVSLSGSFLPAEHGVTRRRTGGLSVALAGSCGQLIGGGVAGMLMAATTVQVVMGSFIAEAKKPKEEQMKREPTTSAPVQTAGFGAAPAASPRSDGSSSDHSDDPGSPKGPSGGTFDSSGPSRRVTYG